MKTYLLLFFSAGIRDKNSLLHQITPAAYNKWGRIHLHNLFHTNRCFKKHLREMAIQSKPLSVYKYFYLKYLTPGLKYAVKILLSNADGFSQVVFCGTHTGSSRLKLTVKIVFVYCMRTQRKLETFDS